jgi:hypothetical protein
MAGGSFTGATVMVKLSLAASRPSLTDIVIKDEPNWFAAGVTVTVRFEPDPPNTTFVTGTRDEFDEVLVSVNVLVAVSESLMVKGIAEVALSSSTLWSLIDPIVGKVLIVTLGELKNTAELMLPMVDEFADR